MFKAIQRIKNRLPRKIVDVWYNVTAHSSTTKFPVIFDENHDYIECEIGLKVKMKELKNGDSVYYEVTRIRCSSGGDWLYPSDNTQCDLKFSHIKSEKINK